MEEPPKIVDPKTEQIPIPSAANSSNKIDSQWVETKREFDVDNEGNYILKKVSVELKNLRKKEYIDLVFKLVGLAAIFIPIILFTIQQKNEFERQKRLFEIETYSNTTTNIQLMLNKSIDNSDYTKAKDELFYRCYPKVKFINDSEILHKLDTVMTYLNLYSILFQKHKDLDKEIYLDDSEKYPKKITSDPGEIYFKTTEDFLLLVENHKISNSPKNNNFHSAILLMMDIIDSNLEDNGKDDGNITFLMDKQTELLMKRNLIHRDLLKLNFELDSLMTNKLNLRKR